jgi:short-subunit dehydrogenase
MLKPDAALNNFSAVIITGGSSGIGKSFIELCAKMRPELAFCNLSRRAPVINNPELNLRHVACDLSRPEQVEGALPRIEDFLTHHAPAGRILLVNNSGFGIYGRFADSDIAQQLEMVDVNVRAVLQLTGALLPAIKSRGGAIINVASTAAFQPTPYLDTYGATKAFLLHWSLGLNEELRGTGVRALAVCPGPTSTEFSRRAGIHGQKAPEPFSQTSEQVVVESLRALAAGKAMVVTGWTNKLSAAIAAKLPKPLVARLAARVMARTRMNRVKP